MYILMGWKSTWYFVAINAENFKPKTKIIAYFLTKCEIYYEHSQNFSGWAQGEQNILGSMHDCLLIHDYNEEHNVACYHGCK